MRICK